MLSPNPHHTLDLIIPFLLKPYLIYMRYLKSINPLYTYMSSVNSKLISTRGLLLLLIFPGEMIRLMLICSQRARCLYLKRGTGYLQTRCILLEKWRYSWFISVPKSWLSLTDCLLLERCVGCLFLQRQFKFLISLKEIKIVNLLPIQKRWILFIPKKDINILYSQRSTGCVPLERCTARISFSQIRM